MNTAMSTAKERQLTWLLDEVLAGRCAGDRSATDVPGLAAQRARSPWLAAAIALFALGVAIGVAVLRGDEPRYAQRPTPGAEEPAPHECHGPAELVRVPADVVRLRCFDFDDDACKQLARFQKLELLDLSGMDVDDRGVSRQPQLTDVGVRALAPLSKLRWLCLAQCHQVKGEGLQALAAIPLLEHLDLTYSGVETPSIERLPLLASLRTLVLSHCMNFHGTALAAVARMPGLRRLELQACTTLSAKDVLSLVALKELRWLDLRDCQGRFRGQRAAGFTAGGQWKFVDTDDDGLPDRRVEESPPPVEDGIGITDDVVAALAALPLEVLLLGGCESLTDAIGDSLAKMTTLRVLDLSYLPKTSGSLLAALPRQLTALSLDRNPAWTTASLRRLPAMPQLRELGLGALPNLDDARLRLLLADKPLTKLRLGGQGPEIGADGRLTVPTDPLLTAAAIEVVLACQDLESLSCDRHSTWLDAAGIARLATLPKLRELDLTSAFHIGDDEVAALAPCRALQSLRLTSCRRVTDAGLAMLAEVPLRELDLYGTKCDPARVRELAARHWPGCTITLPDGQRFRTP